MASGNAVKVGPFGGSGGSPFEFYVDNRYGIHNIVIKTGDYVDSLAITLVDRVTRRGNVNGKFGGSGGSNTNEFFISFKDGEHLKTISGTIENNYVQSLTFITNITTHGPFGKTTGTPFSVPIDDGEVYGFYGRDGNLIDAIGIIVAPPFKS